MLFFVDTANIDEIREANELGILAGVTTNPSLVAKEANVSFHEPSSRDHRRRERVCKRRGYFFES